MLRSADEVIKAVGGSTAAAAITAVGVSAVSNWRNKGVIPAEYFPIFSDELKRRGLTADRSVFSFKRLDA